MFMVSPDISNLHTFVVGKTDYIPHYVDIIRINSKKSTNSGHSLI